MEDPQLKRIADILAHNIDLTKEERAILAGLPQALKDITLEVDTTKLVSTLEALIEKIQGNKDHTEEMLAMIKELSDKEVIVNVAVPDITIPKIELPVINIPETVVNIPKEIDIKKPKWFDVLPILNELKSILKAFKGFKLPKSAKDAIPVRLSDGDKFYKALGGFSSAIAKSPFSDALKAAQDALVDTDRVLFTKEVEVIPTYHTKLNGTVNLDMNVSGDLVKIRKVIDGVEYTKTFSNLDSTVDDTLIISPWS